MNLNRPLYRVVFALALVTAGSKMAAAQITFTGAGGSASWFEPRNWDQGKLPKVDDNAALSAPAASEANPVVIDNSLDPATKDKIAFASRLMVGDGNTAYLLVKSQMSLGDSLRVGNSDLNHTGNGTVTQVGGLVDPAASPQVGTTTGMSGTYVLQGGTFAVGDTNLFIGGNAAPGDTPGKGTFIISGGTFAVGSRVVFGNGGGASFTVIGSQTASISIGDQFNEDGAGKVDLNVQIDKGGLTPISTAILGLPGVTLHPSFAKGVAPYAGTWTVIAYTSLTGNSSAIPVLGKDVDPAHWSAKLDADAGKLLVTYKP